MRCTLTTAALLALAGCSPYTIDADYDHTADFSRYRTWSWFTGPHPYGAGMDPLIDNRIRASLEAELPHTGLSKAPKGSSDLMVSYHASVVQRIEVNPTTTSFGYGWGRGYVGYSSGGEVRSYDEGTLIVDLVDAKTKNLVWRGIARATVYADNTPEERTERIRAAVQAILARYPPIP